MEAILAACNKHGADGRGQDGLEGYLYKLACDEPRTMGMLLRAIMRTQVTVERKRTVYHSFEELKAKFDKLGLRFEMPQLQPYEGPIIDLDPNPTSGNDGDNTT